MSALPGGEQFAELVSVSCSSKGNCAAGGSYQENGSPFTAPAQAFVVTERNGVWGKAKAVRGLAACPERGRGAGVDFMSCRSAGSCTASGTYLPAGCMPNSVTRSVWLAGDVVVTAYTSGECADID